jgi:hypothetical protein
MAVFTLPKVEMVYQAYLSGTPKQTIRKYDSTQEFIPINPTIIARNISISEIQYFSNFENKEGKDHGRFGDLVAFPNGKFSFKDCIDILTDGEVDFAKVGKGSDTAKLINFHRALTLIYGKNKGKYYTYDPWYHIDSLANATSDLNRRV